MKLRFHHGLRPPNPFLPKVLEHEACLIQGYAKMRRPMASTKKSRRKGSRKSLFSINFQTTFMVKITADPHSYQGPLNIDALVCSLPNCQIRAATQHRLQKTIASVALRSRHRALPARSMTA